MNKERENQRLNQMFSNIEVLAVNPVRHHPDIQPESQSPPANVADLEKPLAGDGKSESVTETYAPINLPEDFILQENDQIESVIPQGNPGNLTLPLKSEAQTIAAMQIAPSSNNRQVAAHESGPADWREVGTGALTGTIVTGIILACTSQLDIFNNLGRFAVLGGEVLCGIIGALAAHTSKSTRRDIWIGAIQWSLVPVWIALLIIFFIYLLGFTNFTAF